MTSELSFVGFAVACVIAMAVYLRCVFSQIGAHMLERISAQDKRIQALEEGRHKSEVEHGKAIIEQERRHAANVDGFTAAIRALGEMVARVAELPGMESLRDVARDMDSGLFKREDAQKALAELHQKARIE